jgi:hypothetical protein
LAEVKAISACLRWPSSREATKRLAAWAMRSPATIVCALAPPNGKKDAAARTSRRVG